MNHVLFFVLYFQSIDVALDFVRIDTRGHCTHDALSIETFDDKLKEYISEAKMCGRRKNEHYSFSNGPIRIRFKTDASKTERGFKLRYTVRNTGSTVERKSSLQNY